MNHLNKNFLIFFDIFQASTVIVAGLGIAALGFGARFMLRTIPAMGQKMANAATSIPKLDGEVNSLYMYCELFHD